MRGHAATAISSVTTKSRSRISTNEATAATNATVAPTSRIVFEPVRASPCARSRRRGRGATRASRCDRWPRAAVEIACASAREFRPAARPSTGRRLSCGTCEARIVPSPATRGRDADLAQRRVDPGRDPGARGLDDADGGRERAACSRARPPKPGDDHPRRRCVQFGLGVMAAHQQQARAHQDEADADQQPRGTREVSRPAILR